MKNALGMYGQGLQGSQGMANQGQQAGQSMADMIAQTLAQQANLSFNGQQQQNQNMLNQGMANYATMQQYPMQQLGQLESLYTGAPQNITTQNYTAAPSMISQAAGLGVAGAGAAGVYKNLTGKAMGGRIKAPDNRKKSGAGLGDLALAKLA
jgi:hypothetical protein